MILNTVEENGRIWREIDASVWVCVETGQVHVFGDPGDVEPLYCDEDDERAHNCDASHCSSMEHRIAVGHITGRKVLMLVEGGRAGG